MRHTRLRLTSSRHSQFASILLLLPKILLQSPPAALSVSVVTKQALTPSAINGICVPLMMNRSSTGEDEEKFINCWRLTHSFARTVITLFYIGEINDSINVNIPTLPLGACKYTGKSFDYSILRGFTCKSTPPKGIIFISYHLNHR